MHLPYAFIESDVLHSR